MNWLTRHKISLYTRNSFWLYPTACIVAGLVSVALLTRVEHAMGWEADISPENARGIMGLVAGSLFSLIVLMTSAILLAVQLASAQLTPRIITIIYRDPFRKLVLAAFAFTFTFSVGVFARIEDSVPLFTAHIAAYGFLLNLGLFLFFIDGIGKALRPSAILHRVALIGREVVVSVYPSKLDNERIRTQEKLGLLNGEPDRVVTNEIDGVVLAFDQDGLVRLGQRFECVIQLVPEVGDFVAAGDPLFRVFKGGSEIPAETLRNSIAVGIERTTEQDPMFAFRIMVDIASKALSPAINDPTTAVIAIDQIHHLLREVGNRYLDDGRANDGGGVTRLIYSTPNWEDFVHLATTEIRLYGRDSIQIMRRLRAMLENLIDSLPAMRESMLREELELLDGTVRRTFPDRDDQELAQTADFQGLGGSREAHQRRNERRQRKAATSGKSN
jgi:uncharacterized membrane protein